jgi:DNA-binding transcriptional regulator YdaS (Cro superfamily)
MYAIVLCMDILDLVARVGGTTKLAAALGITKNAPYQWRKIPPRHVPAISKAFDIPRHELRPDLWEKPEE